jgi:hypothetical protein
MYFFVFCIFVTFARYQEMTSPNFALAMHKFSNFSWYLIWPSVCWHRIGRAEGFRPIAVFLHDRPLCLDNRRSPSPEATQPEPRVMPVPHPFEPDQGIDLASVDLRIADRDLYADLD